MKYYICILVLPIVTLKETYAFNVSGYFLNSQVW